MFFKRLTRQFVYIAFVLLAGTATLTASAQDSRTNIGLLKYKGGGDWYSGGRALANLIQYARQNTTLDLNPEPVAVEPSSAELFAYPIIFINGHGNVSFSDAEVANLRAYFSGGGFLFANDDYGMDPSFRREMKKIYPDGEWLELPFNHPVYSVLYRYPNGLPKIHEHDKLPPRGLGLFHDGVMVCFYNVESDLCDGWETQEVHNDPPEKHRAALEMGTNVLVYAMTRGMN